VARDVLIVIPTYDERVNVAPIVRAALEACPRADALVVDDASPDGTGALAGEIAAREPRLHVLHRPRREGLGRAYLDAFRWALARPYAFVAQMDADFSHDPQDLPRLLDAAERADLAVGSRWVNGGGTRNWGLGRRALSRAGSLYARAVLGVRYRDLTSGFKCWRREALERVGLDEVQSEGYAFQIEMTYRAHRRGLRIIEVPIVFTDRRVGQSKMNSHIVREAVLRVWKIRGG
jgi:dolichol-phosphate mannosyltransferase